MRKLLTAAMMLLLSSQDAELKEQWQKLIDKMTEAQRAKAQVIHEAIDGIKLTEKQRIIKK